MFSFILSTTIGTESVRSTALGSQPEAGAIAQTKAQSKSPSDFWQRQPRRRNVIRGIVCPIAPGLIETLTLWHDRPLFLWQGQGNQIRVRDYNQRDQILWEQAVTGQSAIAYAGSAALQPGQLYQWQVISIDATPTNRPTPDRNWATFRMLSTEQRQDIDTALRSLEQQLQQQKASAEDSALSKANFFVDRGLWSDALQVISTVSNPSPQFAAQRSTYLKSLCQSPSPLP